MNIGLKIFTNLSATLVATGGSFGGISYFLKSTVVDISFLSPPTIHNVVSVDGISADDYILDNKNTATKKYLMRNVLSLYWDINDATAAKIDAEETKRLKAAKAKATNITATAAIEPITTTGVNIDGSTFDKRDPIISNAFLINVLSDNSGKSASGNYEPNWSIPSNSIHLLIGTSFTFAQKLFDKIKNFKTDVNEATTPPNLSQSTVNSNYKSHALKMSQIKIDQKNFKDKTDPVYRIDKPNTKDDFLKNHYINLEAEKVELVYAAVDLDINKNVLSLNPDNMQPEELVGRVNQIHAQDRNSIDWFDGYTYRKESVGFGVDFAVLKVSVPIYKLKKEFANYLREVYLPSYRLNKFDDARFELKNQRTKPIVVGGWKPLTPELSEKYQSNNIDFTLKIKEGELTTIRTMIASGISDDNFDKFFESKFFEKVHYYDSDDLENYTITNCIYEPDDISGILTIQYQLKNIKTGIILDKIYKSVFMEFQSVEPEKKSSITNNLDIKFTAEPDEHISKQKYQIFKQKAYPISRWSEQFEDKTYFDYSNIASVFYKNMKAKEEVKDLSSIAPWFQLNKKILNIGHKITVPFIEHHDFKGALAMAYNWNKKDEDTLFGIYEGNVYDNNPLMGQKSSGKIVMFNSPTRYNLVKKNNNYSKPSLGDSLQTKGLYNKLVKAIF